jgi:hypothetical protein
MQDDRTTGRQVGEKYRSDDHTSHARRHMSHIAHHPPQRWEAGAPTEEPPVCVEGKQAGNKQRMSSKSQLNNTCHPGMPV